MLCVCSGKLAACFEQNFAGDRRNCGAGEYAACYSSGESQFFVEFISTHGRDIVSLGVKEQIVQKGLGALYQRRIAGTELSVYFFISFVLRICAVLFSFGIHGILFKSSL